MSRLEDGRQRRPIRFPRVSGDEPRILTPAGVFVMFSPRERG